MNWYHRIAGFSFILIILSLTVILLVQPDRAYSAREKRNLSQKPELSLSSLADGSFMDSIEDYTADQFPGRNALMTVKTTISRLIGKRESQGVYLCENDYLMERFDAPDPDNKEETIQEMADFAARHEGTDFYFLLAPNAIAICPELLPKDAPKASESAYIDGFYGRLGSSFTCIDVRERFFAEKDNVQLYYRTDHHWTTDGAKLAYELLRERMDIKNDIPFTGGVVCNNFFGSLSSKSGFETGTADSIKIFLPEYPEDQRDNSLYTISYADTLKKASSCYETDALSGDDPYQVFFGSNHPLFTIDTSLESDRKLLVIKDSYANCLIPFLIPEYRRITVVDPRYFYDDIDALMISEQFDEVLFLYNVNTLSEDTSLKTVLRNQQ